MYIAQNLSNIFHHQIFRPERFDQPKQKLTMYIRASHVHLFWIFMLFQAVITVKFKLHMTRSNGHNGTVFRVLYPKISTGQEKLAPTGRHGRHVFATLICGENANFALKFRQI